MAEWRSDDEHEMVTLHTIMGTDFACRGFESTGDEFAVERVAKTENGERWTPVLHYNANLEGVHVRVEEGTTGLEAAKAMACVVERIVMLQMQEDEERWG